MSEELAQAVEEAMFFEWVNNLSAKQVLEMNVNFNAPPEEIGERFYEVYRSLLGS